MSVLARFAVTALSAVPATGAWAEQSSVNLQTPVTSVATEIYDMHTLMMIICLVIFVAVFGVMFWSVFHHRKSKGAVAAHFHENTMVEIAWTVIPVLILLGMAWPATKTVISMKDTSNPDITIKATGYQWKWGYDYIKGEGEGIKFVSNMSTPQDQIQNRAAKGENYLLEVDNPMVVPVGKKVRILLTANDVIHAWWVPALGVKQDAIPGFIRDTWFRADQEGIFRGNCAELCGKDHGFMPIEVHVLSAEKYAAWVADQQGKLAATKEDPTKEWALADLVAKGEQVFAANCAACHQANGQGMPPAFPPLDGAAIATGDKAEQIKVVTQGRDGTAMAAFGKQLSATDLAAVITYTRNAWSNQTGEAIQPADITAVLN
ncbi:cytochrome c oxidase subunit II [Denitromonas ohlonensis]|uniref:Cytochrome c oxidase subunit 2 n=2 Tax=Denitromonas TaxID=139331 RepID=A0A558EW21_9RHOO|nr:cytochrome c oxidase subunit II [Denitromonas ohlonensis]TVO63249.1 cytochrome c oxidase subunit II [Denitromonas ohlonensis]TVO76204.1 cytochrome c oxidase subunit II [Denitromonas ohlonensis]TVT77591.1 MAG: cytochrome c oxidase subunit II [Denitromonas halophila]